MTDYTSEAATPQELQLLKGQNQVNDQPNTSTPPTKLQTALAYTSEGLHVVVCCGPTPEGRCACDRERKHTGSEIGKAPLLPNGDHGATTDPMIIRRWLTNCPDANIGIELEQSGLVVIDQDSDAARQEALANGLPPDAPTVRTSNGYHTYCRRPEGWPTTRKIHKGTSGKIDVLTAGIIIAPGSTHRNGTPYTWLVPLNGTRLPDAPEWALPILTEEPPALCIVPPEKSVSPEPENLDPLLARALAAKNGEKVRTLWEGHWQALGYPSQSEADLALCSELAFYAEGDPAAINRVFRTSGLWSDKWDVPHFKNGQTYGEHTVEKALASKTEFYTPAQQVPRPRQFQTASVKDLLTETFAPVRWALPGLITEGLTFLAGKAKQGKSWMCLDAAVAIANGSSALGCVPVEKGRVLYLALEDNKRRLQERLRLMGAQDPDELFNYSCGWQRMDQGGLQALEKWLEDHQDARIIIIDTWKKFCPTKRSGGTAYDDDYAAIGPLQELAMRRGVAILVVGHTRKSGAEDIFDTINGSTALAACADSILVLARERGRADAYLHSTGRDIDTREQALAWDDRRCRWNLLGDADEHRESFTKKTIRQCFNAIGEWLSPTEIADRTGLKLSTVKVTVRRMVGDRSLVTHEGTYAITGVTDTADTEREISSNPSNSCNPCNPVTHVTLPQPSYTVTTPESGCNPPASPDLPRNHAENGLPQEAGLQGLHLHTLPVLDVFVGHGSGVFGQSWQDWLDELEEGLASGVGDEINE